MQTTEDRWVDLYEFHERGWATDDITTGLRSHPLGEALGMTYIATNPRSFTNMIVLDVDDPDAEGLIKTLAWDTRTIPEPNWLTINPHTGHGHVGYWLAAPICTTDAARVKPQHYGAAIYEGLRRTIPGDPGYAGRITRSPFAHPTLHMANDPYTLTDLASQTVLPRSLPKAARQQGLGRNCTLFDDVRPMAYAEWRKHKHYEPFQMAVQMLTETLAIQFVADPLPRSEIRAIANSVSRWVWKHFTQEQFASIQTARIKHRWENDVRSIERRQMIAAERQEVVRLNNETALTYAQIAARMGITVNRVRNLIQYERNLDKKRSA